MIVRNRIVVNTIAAYCRSLYALLLGLFSTRWALQALGTVDYGLYAVVGGLTAFVVFFNGLLSGAVVRFYAFSVGKASKFPDAREGIEECRHWFSIAVFLHTVLPVVALLIGYPVGIWAIEHFLSVPSLRVEDCFWVWRYTCFGCFISMISVPFQAMYTAKQEIAELTIYSFVTTTLNALFLYYIVTHNGVWLVWYAAWMCVMIALPQLIICVRALCVFPECRFTAHYIFDRDRMKQILGFAGMNLFGAVAQLCGEHGLSIIVNKYLGAAKNAAMSIAVGVNGHATSLSSALFGAFQPAITNAAGAGDMKRVSSLAMRVCAFGSLAVIVFALPLILEIDCILKLWLKNPPEGAAFLCISFLIVRIMERLSDGHWVAIFAVGRIAAFRIAESMTYWGLIGLALLMMINGGGIVSIGISLIIGRICSTLIKLWYGRAVAGLSVRQWFVKVFLPIFGVVVASAALGYVSHFLMAQSLIRVVFTTCMCEAVVLPISYCVILTREDKDYLFSKLKVLINHLRGRRLCVV